MKLWIGDKPLTAAKAKEFLGWQEATATGTQKGVFTIGKRRVFLFNNHKNRPIYWGTVLMIKQEILRRKYQFNMENIIIGKTGLVLNGQHRLLGLILAAEEWEAHPGKWKDYWQSEPTIETTMALGAEETDAVVNTMDTARPRTLSDVIYRSEYFADKPMKERREASRMMQYAINIVWDRTAAGMSTHLGIRTHSESLDFLGRHPKLLECVDHIQIINGDGEENVKRINAYISPGYASGLMYLMAASATEGREYQTSSNPTEGQLDMSRWGKAQEFWTNLAQRSKMATPLIQALVKHDQESLCNKAVREGLIIKAWNAFIENGKITPSDLTLEWHTDAEGFRTLNEYPIMGGIDVADAPEDDEEDEVADA